MYYQNEPGIYVYYYQVVYYQTFATRKVNGSYYKSLEEFFKGNTEHTIKKYVGYSINDKICVGVTKTDYGRGYCKRRYIRKAHHCGKINCHEHDEHRLAMAVYDHLGKLYTPDHLIGLYREWVRTRPNNLYKQRWFRRNGCKKSVWGGFRNIKTAQERKWAHAWDDEEFAPKVRAARQGHNLPDSWDDYQRHSDKSWKTQSKRKYQWREK